MHMNSSIIFVFQRWKCISLKEEEQEEEEKTGSVSDTNQDFEKSW